MTENNAEAPQSPPSRPPARSVTWHAGAPRAGRARRARWWALYAGPGVFLALVGLWNLAAVGEPLGWAVMFAGLTATMTAATARNLYRAGYHTGSLQSSVDRLASVTLDDQLERPRPHPADPSPLPWWGEPR